MSRLIWDESGSREYFAGVDRGVLYLATGPGIPWNGLVSINEAEKANLLVNHVDGLIFRQTARSTNFSAALRAFTYPEEFAQCDGTASLADGLYVAQQVRVPFGLSYRTYVGNDIDDLDHGYQIHLIYNAMVAPTNTNHETIDDSVDLTPFEWPIETLPETLTGVGPFAHIIIDSRIAYLEALADLEDALYGTESTAPSLPTPAELIDIFDTHIILLIVDNGDGTWTATAPGDDIIEILDPDTFQITWPSAIPIDSDTFTLSSL